MIDDGAMKSYIRLAKGIYIEACLIRALSICSYIAIYSFVEEFCSFVNYAPS